MTVERWQRIKEIFQEAAERAPEDRDGYVEAETAGDADLRCEIEKMLRHASGAGLLDTPAWQGAQIASEFAPGSRLGPYEILEPAGAGGMGRVYKARDLRLGRTVAIKVLSPEFRHRLRREGRAISALNHPHVCALYDIGEQDGTAYLVMEYLEGESLTNCLARGPLAYQTVLRYGAEIAGALSAAHAQGIVHRDLKPANIMITASGAKVLDFGVARMAEDRESDGDAVAGTAAYMSPSQLNGNPAEARSDIFALGLVLFEMAAGVRYSPEARAALAQLPAGLAGLIERCLQDDAAGRPRDMDEVRSALEELRAAPARPSRRRIPLARIAAVLAIAMAARVVTWKLAPRSVPETRRPAAAQSAPSSPPLPVAAPLVVPIATHAPAEPPSLAVLASYPGIERDPSFSPDGKRVAFAWHRGDRNEYGIYVRPVKGDAPPLQLTDGAADWGPAWSPDGRRIAFRRRTGQTGIYQVDASGGPANLVAATPKEDQETLPQLSWSHDGKWIAAPDRSPLGGTGIYLFAAGSGERRGLTTNVEGTDHAPAFSPDGKSLAYASCLGAFTPCDVYVVELGADLAARRQRRITEEGTYIRGLAWLPDGRALVYAGGEGRGRDTFLWRVSVSPPGLPQRIDMAGAQARHPTVSSNGQLLAFTRMGNWRLMMIKNFQ